MRLITKIGIAAVTVAGVGGALWFNGKNAAATEVQPLVQSLEEKARTAENRATEVLSHLNGMKYVLNEKEGAYQLLDKETGKVASIGTNEEGPYALTSARQGVRILSTYQSADVEKAAASLQLEYQSKRVAGQ